MKIGVCLKQVPANDAPLHLDGERGWICEADTPFVINEPDRFALEEGLRLREQLGGELLALSLGPQRVTRILRDALALGADRALHLVAESPHLLDPLQLATVLANALRDEGCDLILTGLQSDDLGSGQTGPLVAQRLGLPHASLVVEVIADGTGLRVRSELEEGWFQWHQLPLPALLTIQSGINRPRYANMKGIMAAKRRPIETLDSTELLPADLLPGQRLGTLTTPHKERACEWLEGAPAAVVAQLIERLGL